ncbi:methyltransferase domain-containing protein [Thermomonas carbonis]|uniref:Class I SAM-dependent methyltransferase n=1 Tax=Thermomonas carbonis TaxID=1463158 RepID=A0A7G9SN60_9GAMM|nr:class I SAM-dependent methyltransferase [Thermomonas carbonis]QNN69285.1 class I SAM-dependent methyltransferase [Thermomonas carbonis]GHC05495.1 hypothetical protein GCM10010080_19150 [Thermomonas carbonis]
MSHYDDGYSIRAYGEMICDEARFTPWHEALRRHIHADSVVLDIGCGTGIMSFLACRYGARRVFAVEPSVGIEIGKSCAANIPGAERIEWIRGMSTEIDLPEKADLVVGDLHGNLPFFTGNIASLADARKRHLKPDGRLLPKRDLLYAAPATAPEEMRRVDTPWRHNAFGLDLSAALPHMTNRYWRARPEPIAAGRLLAAPAHWGTVHYTDEETRALDRTLDWTLERDGMLHGLYVWFDGLVDDGLGFSNSPLLPELVYGRCFFPLSEPVLAQAGDRMQTRLAVKRVQGDWVYRWDTRIETRTGERKATFRQSTFQLLPGQSDLLRKSTANYIPTLSEDGLIERSILEQMDGHRSLTDIAQEMLRRFPGKFRDFDRALAAVAKLSSAHG